MGASSRLVITWLGTVIETSQYIISATDTRIQSLLDVLSVLLDSTHPSLYQVRKLASACGKIISLGNCVGNVVRLMTTNIFAVINSAMNWCSMVSLTPGCADELNFWKVNLVHINGVPLWPIKRRLFTPRPLFQPAVASLLLMAKFFTKIGPTSRDLRVQRFVSS